jgi:zinc protease
VVLVEESHDVPIVELLIVFRAGASIDPAGREGALALALRSLRRGAGTREALAIDEQIDRLGAELSTSVDASSATIHATVIRRNLEPFLDLLADLVLRPTFPEGEIAQVVRETRADIIDSRNDDRTLAARHFRRTLFAGHPYGRPPSGTLETLARLSRHDAQALYARSLVAPNVVVGAAGDITQAELEAIVRDRFGAIADGTPPPEEIPEPPRRKGRRLVIVDKPERTQSQIYIGCLGTHPRDRDHTALVVANTIFGGTFTARLMREVRSKRGWSYGASSRLGRDRAREAWSMWTFPAARDAAACIELQLELLDDLLERGVTDRELAFAKSYISRSYAFEVDTAAKRLGQRLDQLVLGLPRDYYTGFVERVQAVTREDANAAVRRRLSRRDLLVTIVATARELRAALEKAIPDLEETRVISFESDEIQQG